MVCICGVIDNHIYIGSDSIVQGSITLPGHFVYKKYNILFGIYASYDAIYKLKYEFIPPERGSWVPLEVYMSLYFFKQFSQVCTEHVKAIIGISGSLFYIDSHVGAILCSDGYFAIGEGSTIALGSFYSTKDMPAYKRITTALYAATKHSLSVRPPYTILTSNSYAVGRNYIDQYSDITEAEIQGVCHESDRGCY